MRDKKPGAIVTGEPKMIWVKYWINPTAEKYGSLKDKFNAILEEILTGFRHTYILDISEAMAATTCYDCNGNLNNQEKNTMWREINQTMKKFDNQEISLKPEKVVTKAQERQKEDHNRYLLPKRPKISHTSDYKR